MSMGIINKVILVFPRIFWPLYWEKFGQLPEPNPSSSQAEFESNRGKYFLFQNMYNETNLPCLVVYISGQAAQDAENLTDDQILKEVLDRLSAMFPDETPLPKPIETVTTRWGKDCFSGGSSTILRPEGSFEEFSVAIQDAKRLYFAGEHIGSIKPGSVAGNCI